MVPQGDIIKSYQSPNFDSQMCTLEDSECSCGLELLLWFILNIFKKGKLRTQTELCTAHWSHYLILYKNITANCSRSIHYSMLDLDFYNMNKSYSD